MTTTNPLSGVYALDLVNTAGALHILAERSSREFSADTLHYYIKQGKLPAFVFTENGLQPWKDKEHRRGQTLVFLKRDVYALGIEPTKRGRKSVSAKIPIETP